jgi:hypothetical protein
MILGVNFLFLVYIIGYNLSSIKLTKFINYWIELIYLGVEITLVIF